MLSRHESSEAGLRGYRLPELLGLVVIGLTLVTAADLLPAMYGLTGILVAQIGLVLAPTLLVAGLAADARSVLRLRLRPMARHLLSAVALGCGLWLVATALIRWQQLILAPDAAELAGLANLRRQVSERPGLATLALVVAPAIAEEALFRGLVLHGLQRRMATVPAVLLNGALFALFHRSVHRTLVQGIFGLASATLAVRSGSLIPSILMHAIYNAGILHLGDQFDESSWVLGLSACGVALGGLGLAGRARPDETKSLHKTSGR